MPSVERWHTPVKHLNRMMVPKATFKRSFKNIIIHLCACFGHECVSVHVWRKEVSLGESALSFHHVGSGNGARVIRLAASWSHFPSPKDFLMLLTRCTVFLMVSLGPGFLSSLAEVLLSGEIARKLIHSRKPQEVTISEELIF